MYYMMVEHATYIDVVQSLQVTGRPRDADRGQPAAALVGAAATALRALLADPALPAVHVCYSGNPPAQWPPKSKGKPTTAAAAADNRSSVLLFRNLLCCRGASSVAGRAKTLQAELQGV
jgi:hypothetical protein